VYIEWSTASIVGIAQFGGLSDAPAGNDKGNRAYPSFGLQPVRRNCCHLELASRHQSAELFALVGLTTVRDQR
jgi:hypothetical protein